MLTKKELKTIDGGRKNKCSKTYNKNELRRRGLCYICKRPWALNHSCLGDRKEETRKEQEEIPSNHGESSIVGSIDFQDGEQQCDVIHRDLHDEKHSKVHDEIIHNGINGVDSYTTYSIGL